MTLTFFLCPACDYSIIVDASAGARQSCLLCAADCGHDTEMHGRPAQPEDIAEGRDDRISTPVRTSASGCDTQAHCGELSRILR